MKRTLLCLCLLLPYGCGVGQKITALVGDPPNEANLPAPLIEFTDSVDVTKIWSKNIGAGTDGQYLKLSPAIAGERVFITDSNGKLRALSADSGKPVWDNDTKLPITGGMGAGQTLVLAGTREGEVVAFDPESGDELWRSQVSSEILATPRQAGNIVIVRTNDGKIFAIDASEGRRLWTYERTVPALTLRGNGVPVIANDTVIAGFDGGRITALERQTGGLVWEATVAEASGRSELERMVDIDIAPIIIEKMIYTAAFQGRVAALDLDNGEQIWNREISSFAGVGADAQRVYVTDDESHIWALDRFTGVSVWKQEDLRARAATAPVVIGDMVIVGDFEGYLHWMDKLSGEFVARTRLSKSQIIVPPIIYDEMLYAYSSDGTIGAYAYSNFVPVAKDEDKILQDAAPAE